MINIEKVYNLYFKDVYYFILALSKNEEIAKEVTSETFFKILKNFDGIKNSESIKYYILKTAKHIFFDYLKKNKIDFIGIEYMDFMDDSNNPEEEYLKIESNNALYMAIGKLDDVEQMIVKLRAFEEISFKEIGKLFGKSENWACVKFHRAKGKLKKYLEEYYE